VRGDGENVNAQKLRRDFYEYTFYDVYERKIDASLYYYKKESIDEGDLRELLTNQYHINLKQ